MMQNSLPVFLTPLIGRDQELSTLEQLLRHPGVRLVTLTGPGGVGKTRLAVAAAANLAADYPKAITFVSLVTTNNPNLVLMSAATAIGIQDGDDTSRTALERITRYIHEKKYLLVIDNFEHVIEAASSIPRLLAACPNLKIIATSRQSLGVRGEQEFAVPLLGMPDNKRLAHDADLAEVLPQYSAVRLFLDRMRAIRINYHPDQAALRSIAAICIHLDGLPLAIELAAPRTRVFSPEQLLAQLGEKGEPSSLKLLSGGARDLPARQQTLSRTIQWSYDLLQVEEQRVFRAVSIFAGTFALSEAEKLLKLSSGKGIKLAITEAISSLVDKNLLSQDASEAEPRFRMLAMLQAFGRAEARQLGEMPALNAAHAALFLEQAEEAVPRLYIHEQIEVTARLRRDVDNLRQALRWALNQGEIQLAACFGAALWRFWLLSGLLIEGQEWLKEILARLSYDLAEDKGQHEQFTFTQTNSNTVRISPSEARMVAELLYGLGNLAYNQSGSGRPEVARWLNQSRELYLQSGDQIRAALAMTALARIILSLHEDLSVSQRLLDESFIILQKDGHKAGMAENMHTQAHNYFYLNQPDKAAQTMAHSLVLLREFGNTYELAHAIQFAGDLTYGWVGSHAEVRRYYAEAAEMFAALGNSTETARARAIASIITGQIEGDWEKTLDLVEEGWRIAREHGNECTAASCGAMASWVYGYLGNYGRAKSIAQQVIRTAFSLSRHMTLRTAFIGLANAERLEGDYAAAVATVSALMSFRMHYHSLAHSRGNSIYVISLNQMKRDLAPAIFEMAWSRGPARLAELLPQPETDRISWPLAPVPRMDPAITSGHHEGRSSLVSSDTGSPASPFPEPLTAREKEVLKYLLQGMTDPQIAEVLVVSPRTIHAHLRHIYSKLGVSSRTAAALLALKQGLV